MSRRWRASCYSSACRNFPQMSSMAQKTKTGCKDVLKCFEYILVFFAVCIYTIHVYNNIHIQINNDKNMYIDKDLHLENYAQRHPFPFTEESFRAPGSTAPGWVYFALCPTRGAWRCRLNVSILVPDVDQSVTNSRWDLDWNSCALVNTLVGEHEHPKSF